MRRRAAALLLCAACFAAPAARAAPQYVTLAALREEVRGGWHETYEAHGRTVAIDLDILVPEAEAAPVLKVERAPAPEDALLAAYDVIERYPNGSSLLGVSKGDPGRGNLYKTVKGKVTEAPIRYFDAPDIDWNARAEDNPLDMRRAADIALDEIERLYGPEMRAGFEVKTIGAGGKAYYWEGCDGARPILKRPVDAPGNIGTYYIDFRAVFRGIPVIFGGGGWFADYIRGELPSDNPMACSASGDVATPEDYSLGIHAAREIEMRHADVPLAPFAEVKKALETQIQNGRVRTLERLELGYVQYYDPERADASWLVPCWVAFGEMYSDASGEPRLYADKEMSFAQKENGWLIVRAQTGALQDSFDRSKTRRYVPETFGWEAVR